MSLSNLVLLGVKIDASQLVVTELGPSPPLGGHLPFLLPSAKQRARGSGPR